MNCIKKMFLFVAMLSFLTISNVFATCPVPDTNPLACFHFQYIDTDIGQINGCSAGSLCSVICAAIKGGCDACKGLNLKTDACLNCVWGADFNCCDISCAILQHECCGQSLKK